MRLPNTTLWGPFDSSAAVKAAFDRARLSAEKRLKKIIVEKWVITKLGSALLNSDKRKAPDAKWKKKAALETCRAHQLHDEYFAY